MEPILFSKKNFQLSICENKYFWIENEKKSKIESRKKKSCYFSGGLKLKIKNKIKILEIELNLIVLFSNTFLNSYIVH